MAIDLAAVNMTLDIVLKLLLLGILVGAVVVLKHLDDAVQKAGRSANTVTDLAQKLHSMTSARSVLRGLRKMHSARKGERIDVE